MVWAFLAYTSITFDNNIRLAIGYAILAPQLMILMWEIGLSYRRRLLIFLLYLAAGVALLASTTTNINTAKIAFFAGVVAAIPMCSLPVLFIRWLPPFVGFLVAAAIEIFGVGILLDRYGAVPIIEKPEDLPDIHPLVPILGLANLLLGPVLAWVLLRGRRRWIPVAAGIAGVIAALLLDRDLAQQNLPMVMRIVCFVAVSVLQAMILWSLFKCFVWLQKRFHLTSELVQIHLCWMFLTAYFVLTTLFEHPFYEHPAAVGAGVVVALAVQILLLHLLLFRVRRRHRADEMKRLLLLRAFGEPNEREDLLDALDDTWRRIGAVDMLAAGDVAIRTLEATVLEAVLLHREDTVFLSTDQAVDRRIAQLRSDFETDVRHPVNALYCQEGVWRHAFAELVKKASVVLMDLRGFTTENRGCREELIHLLNQKSRPPLVLLVDAHSDRVELERIVRETGAPRDFIALQFDNRSAADRHALFELLLGSALHPEWPLTAFVMRAAIGEFFAQGRTEGLAVAKHRPCDVA
jgi:hypothetical protein